MAAKDLFGNDLPEPDPFDNLTNEDEETQLEEMRNWFFANFQDPVEETPYDSAEGGYIYLYGGPYHADEVLREKFEGKVSDEVLEKLIQEIGNISWEWEGRPKAEDYDDYAWDTIARSSEQLERYNASVANIRKLVAAKIDPAEEQFFLRMLFASVVTVLETYLSDRFVSSMRENPKALKKFVETLPRFRDEGFKLNQIFEKWKGLEHRVRTILLGEIVWHRLISIRSMFKDTFDVDFPELTDLADLLRGIDIRHDLIHRSGRTKDGVEHMITPEAIEKLIVNADALVTRIEAQNDKLGTSEPKPEEPPSPDDIAF